MIEHGARLTLRLARRDPEAVVYAAALTTPDCSWTGDAAVRVADGNVELSGFSPAPPQWLGDTLRALLRSLWRARADAAAQWPKRVTRWRAEPEA